MMASANMFDSSDTTFTQVTYSVNATGDALFASTIGGSDSPDYNSDKAAANAQCVAVSPKAIERVA